MDLSQSVLLSIKKQCDDPEAALKTLETAQTKVQTSKLDETSAMFPKLPRLLVKDVLSKHDWDIDRCIEILFKFNADEEKKSLAHRQAMDFLRGLNTAVPEAKIRALHEANQGDISRTVDQLFQIAARYQNGDEAKEGKEGKQPPQHEEDPNVMSMSMAIFADQVEQKIRNGPLPHLSPVPPAAERKQAPGGEVEPHDSNSLEDDFPVDSFWGQPLEEVFDRNGNVPPVLNALRMELRSRGMNTEGLFRIGGEKARVARLIDDISTTGVLSVHNESIHTLASVFKAYWRDLEEPLLTKALYPEFLAAARENSVEEARLQVLLDRLPASHRRACDWLFDLLVEILKGDNRMTDYAIGVCWAPNILRENKELRVDEINIGVKVVCGLLSLYQTIRENNPMEVTPAAVQPPVIHDYADQVSEQKGLSQEAKKLILSVTSLDTEGGSYSCRVDFDGTHQAPQDEALYAYDWIGLYQVPEGLEESKRQVDSEVAMRAYFTWHWAGRKADEPVAHLTFPTVPIGTYFVRYWSGVPDASTGQKYTCAATTERVFIGPVYTMKTAMKPIPDIPEDPSEVDVDQEEDPFVVTVTTTLQSGHHNKNTWVGLYPDSTTAPQSYVAYQYLPEALPELTFRLPKAGAWELRLFSHGYKCVATAQVQISGQDHLFLNIVSAEAHPSGRRTLEVHVTLQTLDPAKDQVWVGIYHDTEENTRNYRRYQFVKALGASVMSFKAPIHEGTYEARLFARGNLKPLVRSVNQVETITL